MLYLSHVPICMPPGRARIERAEVLPENAIKTGFF
jgi:hypothetical protein